mmetsp:Transcript_22511/g.25336  ORF Transcript_22511/g.25336 Transcript_22511/m.25336 type:complete len:313 (+) Transcript_22511:58-996(+)
MVENQRARLEARETDVPFMMNEQNKDIAPLPSLSKSDQFKKKNVSSNRKKQNGNKRSSRKQSFKNCAGNTRALSHALSWALRHSAKDIGLNILDDGYVPVQEIIDSTHPRLRDATIENIRNVVDSSDKKRFKLDERPRHLFYPNDNHDDDNDDDKDEIDNNTTVKSILCIRANQGHSITLINPEKLLNKLTPSELRSLPCIVHGTYLDAWGSIQTQKGLKKMNRTHIHFASGLPDDTGVISGMRKNCGVYIYINALKCATDGIDFYVSDNGVILTDGIANSGVLPIEYFSQVTDKLGKFLLDNRDADDATKK